MVIKEIIDDKMLYMDLFRCGGLVGIVGIVQRGFQVFEHRPKACYGHTASPLSRQQEFCCDVFQHRADFFVQLRGTGFIRKRTQLFKASKKGVRRNRSRFISQRSLLHIFSCTQPAFSGLCLNLLFFHCRNSYGNSYILSHAHLSFRGIGGCAPKESADFGCDWDFCGTQSPCLLYRETHPAGHREKRLPDTEISANFYAARY